MPNAIASASVISDDVMADFYKKCGGHDVEGDGFEVSIGPNSDGTIGADIRASRGQQLMLDLASDKALELAVALLRSVDDARRLTKLTRLAA